MSPLTVIYILSGTTIAMCLVVVATSIIALIERKRITHRENDLMNRLMSRTLSEYLTSQKVSGKKPKKEKSIKQQEAEQTYRVT